jgi:hypothetical protein
MMNRLVTMLGAGVAAVMLSGGAWAAGDTMVTPAQIEAAKTPADHEAIAAAYDTEAAQLESMAKKHEAMAKTYQTAATGMKGANPAVMSAHCNKLVTEYKAAAQQNRDLAAAHRQMAKDSGAKK